MTEADIPRLAEIRPSFTSLTVLEVQRTGSGVEAGWRLIERPLPKPFDKGDAYDFDAVEQANIRRRFLQGDGLHLVVENADRLVGILDATPQEWNSTVLVWNLMLDQSMRGQGIGSDLFRRTAVWAQRQGYRALLFETQTNNVPACKFYAALGCRLEGIREAFYTNDDMENHEVAVFWIYPLE